MFEHLSSEPEPPGPEVRDAVRRRARGLRQRRWVGAGTAGAVALGVVLAVILSGPTERSAVLFVDEPSPTPTPSVPAALVTADPTPDPTVSPTPEPSVTPTPVPAVTTVAATPSASPSPACDQKRADQCPDGKPGWSYGFSSSCHDAAASEVPAAREVLFDGVTATWVLPRTTVRGGESLPGKVRVHSTRQDHVAFDVSFGPGASPAVYGEGRGGAVHLNELFLPGPHVDLLPGQTQTFDVGVGTTGCADTPDLPEPPLPAGSYAAGETFTFQRATTVVDSSGTATPEPTPVDGPVPARGEFAVRLPLTVT